MATNGFEVTAQEVPDEQKIFTAAWNYLKAYAKLKQDDDDEYWKDCSEEFSKIFNMGKTEETKGLSAGIAAAVFKYIEIRSKK